MNTFKLIVLVVLFTGEDKPVTKDQYKLSGEVRKARGVPASTFRKQYHGPKTPSCTFSSREQISGKIDYPFNI